MPITTTKKHRAPRAAETIVTLALGTMLIVLAAVMALRG